MTMTEEEMRQALFGSGGPTVRLAAPQAHPNTGNNQSAKAAAKQPKGERCPG